MGFSEELRIDPPDKAAREQAIETSHELATILGKGEKAELCLEVDGNRIQVPLYALNMLQEILEVLARGDAVSIIPINAVLTTQQSADLMNVSRPYFVKLLEKGKIPFQRVGTHRKVLYRDLKAYIDQMQIEQAEAMDELAKLDAELGL